jgi:WD repeat-containing protein 61
VVEADAAGSFVVSVAYSADGRRLACGSMGGTVAVFDTATSQLLHTLPGLSMAVRGLSWGSAAGGASQLAAACDDGHVHLYNAESGQLLADCAGHSGAALSVSLAPGGDSLVSGGADGSVRLWDARTGRCSQALLGEHGEAVWGVAHSPSGAYVASVSDDRSVGLFSCQ